MIKTILTIAAITIILIAFWCYANKDQKKEEYDFWIRYSRNRTASNEQLVTLD